MHFHLRSQKRLRSSLERASVRRDDWFVRLVRSVKGDYFVYNFPEWQTLLTRSGEVKICAASRVRGCGQNWLCVALFTRWATDTACIFQMYLENQILFFPERKN